MARQIFTAAAVLSTILLAVTVGLILLGFAGFDFDPRKQAIPLDDSCHAGILRRGFDVRVVFFNDREYGPYTGSLLGVTGKDGKMYPPLKRREAMGDSWGVYYRFFEWPDGSQLWTLAVSLWYPAAVFFVLPIVWILRRHPRKGRANAGS